MGGGGDQGDGVQDGDQLGHWCISRLSVLGVVKLVRLGDGDMNTRCGRVSAN
jgi:hypothetical protein